MKLLIIALLFTIAAQAENWPHWRGPTHDGRCAETDLPLNWSADEGIAWKVKLPERGNSTPVIWGQWVFVTQPMKKGQRRALLCFDKATGKQLWEAGTDWPEDDLTHATNPHCSGSPATDGKVVIANFASAGVCAYDTAGRELWRADLGPQRHIWGPGTSPVLWGDLCLINHGPGKEARLVALDRMTGKLRWEHREPADPKNEQFQRGFYGSWSNPLPLMIDGLPRIVMSWPYRVAAFDAPTGKELWECTGLNPLVYTSPIVGDDLIVSMGGYSGQALAVKVGSHTGDITSSARQWHHAKSPQRIASGAIKDGYLYIVNDPGTAQCIELKTGETKWLERIGGQGKNAQNWSSVVISGDRCYIVNQGGDAVVFEANPKKLNVLATNAMGEKIIGSIAVSDGRLFIRGHEHLFCVGKP
jgi:outer membrane protein assembly factor BamB